ncbi:MAG: DedA family protein [Planctomycetaceae bacterium]
MDTLRQLLDIVRHLDEHLAELSAQMGGWLYALLFSIIFAETGLVVFPFLPGDSLLFAIGALVAVEGSGLSLPLMTVLLLVAAIAGDAVNYAIGRAVGPRVFSKEDSWLLNKKHLLKAEAFYQRHGGKAVFLARFAPLLRTFAPFVAGIGRMNLLLFWFFNISGGICWVVGFLLAGFFFGNIPAVKRNFEFVILGIVIVSLLPVVIEWYRSRNQPV